MDILSLGLVMILSFWWLDRSLANWKREQDKKLQEIKEEIIKLHLR